MEYSSFMYSDIGGRKENEDSIAMVRQGTALISVLCDGLGGQGDGKTASALVCRELTARSPANMVPDRSSLQNIFKQANTQLMMAQENMFHRKTTAVYLCLCANQAIWGHVGDSRLYHIHNGVLRHYTSDHSVSQMSVRMGLITREQLPSDANRSRLLCAMGIEDAEPEIMGPMSIEPGRHAFLLCSDGLWEYLTDQDIVRVGNEAVDAKAFIMRLKEIRDKRSKPDCDNHSAIAIITDDKKRFVRRLFRKG